MVAAPSRWTPQASDGLRSFSVKLFCSFRYDSPWEHSLKVKRGLHALRGSSSSSNKELIETLCLFCGDWIIFKCLSLFLLGAGMGFPVCSCHTSASSTLWPSRVWSHVGSQFLASRSISRLLFVPRVAGECALEAKAGGVTTSSEVEIFLTTFGMIPWKNVIYT